MYLKTRPVCDILIKSGPVPHWYNKGTSVSFTQAPKSPSTSLPCSAQKNPLNLRTHIPFVKKRRNHTSIYVLTRQLFPVLLQQDIAEGAAGGGYCTRVRAHTHTSCNLLLITLHMPYNKAFPKSSISIASSVQSILHPKHSITLTEVCTNFPRI